MVGRDNLNFDINGINSPILATKYAHLASGLIRALGKSFLIIIGLIAALIVLSMLDALHGFGYTNPIPDSVYDSMIAVFSAILFIASLYVLNTLLKSRRMLKSWANTFERNSVQAGMQIAMANKSKEEAIHAIAETVQEIGEPLRMYISTNESKNFFDVAIKKNNIEVFF